MKRRRTDRAWEDARPLHEAERRAPARHVDREEHRAELELGAPITVQGFNARNARSGNSLPDGQLHAIGLPGFANAEVWRKGAPP